MELFGNPDRKEHTKTQTMEFESKVVVSFRGKKTEVALEQAMTVGEVKRRVLSVVDPSMDASDMKLMCKGKVLTEDDKEIVPFLTGGKKLAKVYRLMATGMSTSDVLQRQKEFEEGMKAAPRIRDDLTKSGRVEMARRQRLGRRMMEKSNKKHTYQGGGKRNGFGRIETIPNLPDQAQARDLLTRLSQDPGVLACMAKHGWHVGCLAELYPKGKVGESAVCVMGLNEKKGQRILLRIRTDDLRGFRKLLSIRKVLFHELAHNVHSEHNQEFFQLMRQIEQECNSMDWTEGNGLSSRNEYGDVYEGGTYRLGGNRTNSLSTRELASRAAMLRLSAEDEEIERNCGCGQEGKFLP